MRSVFHKIESSLQPLETISAFSEAAASQASSITPPTTDEACTAAGGHASEAARGCKVKKGQVVIDPMQQTYHLMSVQRMAEAKLRKLADPALAELAAQASRLVSLKMDVYWDLLSLQDPSAPPSACTSRRKAVSIREYSLVEPLGSGGFGTVWLARRKRTGDLTAIKVLSKADTVARKMLSSVRLEKNILASADCPYVVKLFFSFATARHLYMVMEYLPGGDCLALVQSYGFLEEEVARWFCAEALLGLQYLHHVSIIHRDVKPSNMLITADGHIKLADFGLSAAGEADEPNASPSSSDASDTPGDRMPRPIIATAAVGTPDYLAPELLRRGGYSYEVDFWALGVVLYQFLIGEPPFAADSPAACYQKILQLDCYFPNEEDLTSHAASVLRVLLVSDPSKRLGAAGGVGDIFAHPFFAALPVECGGFSLLGMVSPYTPPLVGEGDTSNFVVNAFARVTADRMRTQLEADVSDGSDKELDCGAGSGGESEEGSFSFQTVNHTMLARMQLEQRR